MANRYDTSHNPEGQYQPGSSDLVLKNKPGITDAEEMDQCEFDALAELQDVLFDELEIDQKITSRDLSDWHRRWLGEIYSWAGDFRSVNIAKGGFMFAAANLIPKLMADFERHYLSKYTPSNDLEQDELVAALAICHVEFIVIHPYREGNGRLGRLLATVMALQAGMPPLDFTLLENDKARYIAAIHAGHAGDYEPMQQIFSEVLQFTLNQVSASDE